MPKYSSSFAPTRRRRSPVGAILLLIPIVLIGFLVYLGLARHETPLERIEQDVTNEIPAR